MAVKRDMADMCESGGGGCGPRGGAIIKAEGGACYGLGGLHLFRWV